MLNTSGIILTFILSCLYYFTWSQVSNTQIDVQGRSNVVVTGDGNTIKNTTENKYITQIFGKSLEYAALKKTLEMLDADIQKKAATCETMERDKLPKEYLDGCRAELVELNVRRDSTLKLILRSA
ncbi:MAG: hypothetical protein ACK4TA_25545 [Saprospiraceae bacterium]